MVSNEKSNQNILKKPTIAGYNTPSARLVLVIRLHYLLVEGNILWSSIRIPTTGLLHGCFAIIYSNSSMLLYSYLNMFFI